MSLNSPRAPVPRIPFFHESRRPWYILPQLWDRLQPRDHSHQHLSTYSHRLNQASHASHSRRFFPSSFADLAPRRHRGFAPPHLRDPFRPPCRKFRRHSWNPEHPRELAHTIPRINRKLLSTSELLPLQNNSESISSFQHHSFLTPIIPGVTVPAGDVWYILAAVLFAAVVHELGHALAAAAENGSVSAVGGFLAMVLPGAYVRLEGVNGMNKLAQLRVYCAGAWHNLVTAVLALIAVGWLPTLMIWGWRVGEGALVVAVPDDSALKGFVEVGDVILRLGRFDVKNGGEGFRGAVSSLITTNDTVGFCVNKELYTEFARKRSKCCRKEYMDSMEAAEALKQKCFRVEGMDRRTSCIDPHVVAKQPTCRKTQDCAIPEDLNGRVYVRNETMEEETGMDQAVMIREEETGKPTACLLPVLPVQQQLVDVRVRSLRSGDVMHFFYEGYPQVLGQSVSVSSYVPRGWGKELSGIIRLLARADIPNAMERWLQYLCSLSLGLAVLNMAPVLYLDGEMSSALFATILLPRMSKGLTEKVRSGIVICGTVLLLLNMLIAALEVETTIL